MNTKNNIRAALLGIVVALGAALSVLASSDVTQAMTDPCAKVMNWPARAIADDATPPSERGLQCPIFDDFAFALE